LVLLLLRSSMLVLGDGVGDKLGILSSKSGQPLSELFVLECL